MRNWVTRFMALSLILALVASPQVAVMAAENALTTDSGMEVSSDSATPAGNDEENSGRGSDDGSVIPEEDEDSTGPEESDIEGAEPNNESGEGDQSDGDTQAEDTGQGDSNSEASPEADGPSGTGDVEDPDVVEQSSARTDVGLLNAPPEDTYGFTNPIWNGSSFSMEMVTFPGFEVQAGDTIDIFYTSDTLALNPLQSDISSLPIEASVNSATETLTLTFIAPYSHSGGEGFVLAGAITLEGTIQFPECGPGDAYTNVAEVALIPPSYYPLFFSVDGDECPASVGPVVVNVGFTPEIDAIYFEIEVPEVDTLAGQQLTITYQQDKLSPDPRPVPLYADYGVEAPVATAVASDGVITITFNDTELPEGYESLFVSGWVSATVLGAGCDSAVADAHIIDVGRLLFVASPGGAFSTFLQQIVCNAAAVSLTGELSADGTQILWTIDTGHLINGGYLSTMLLTGGFQYICDSAEVTVIEGEAETDFGCEDGSWIDFELVGSGPVRAIITIRSDVLSELEMPVILSCVTAAYANPGISPTVTAAANTGTGHGGVACAEVALAGVGDYIALNPGSTELDSGDELTYSISFGTSSPLWWTLNLNHILPDGFEVDDITCAIEIPGFDGDDCFQLEGNVLSVNISQSVMSELLPESGSVTLIITGIVSADPGSVLEAEACYERSFNAPQLPPFFSTIGSGVLCDSMSVTVLQVDDPDPSPSPTPSPSPDPSPSVTPDPDPATPGVTPTVTPDTGATATATSGAVTGLPETGNSGSSNVVTTLLIAAMAASVLMATAVGIRLRTRT